MSSKCQSSPREVRGPSRRRRETNVSDFIRATFTLANECPAEIGEWSEEGDTFIIKDCAKFANEVIPMYYKHNKLASFIRQLNSYGFRQVRRDTTLQTTWKEFRHTHFLRGRPEKLAEIKKLNCSNYDVVDRVLALEKKVQILEGYIRQLRVRLDSSDTFDELPNKRQRILESPNDFDATFFDDSSFLTYESNNWSCTDTEDGDGDIAVQY